MSKFLQEMNKFIHIFICKANISQCKYTALKQGQSLFTESECQKTETDMNYNGWQQGELNNNKQQTQGEISSINVLHLYKHMNIALSYNCKI